MDYIILGMLIVAYFSLSGELKSIKNKIDNKQKTKVNLKELVGKTVKVYLDDEYDIELVGKLISYDKKWFELEENKKKNNVIHYKRIDNIKSITLKDI